LYCLKLLGFCKRRARSKRYSNTQYITAATELSRGKSKAINTIEEVEAIEAVEAIKAAEAIKVIKAVEAVR
jgi:hypothetical protein